MRSLLILLMLVGCGAPGYIKASAIDGTLRRVIERHDAYTDADPALDEKLGKSKKDKQARVLQYRTNKRDTELLLELLDEVQESEGEE